MAYGIHQSPVLIGYDGSEHAKAAIRETARHLRPGRHAIVLTVWHPYEALPVAGAPTLAPAEDILARIEKQALAIAEEGARLASSAGFDAIPLAEPGHPASRRILEAADEYNASIVVLGSHGRANLASDPIGSVAASVVQQAKRPVLVIHAPARAVEERERRAG
jgi:nucleotide-binding universal stress UspA family protein